MLPVKVRQPLDGLATETITWNVSGTNSGLISTPNVDIFFSLDGYNYDIVLATGVPNDGSHDIMVPNVDTTTGRVKVKGSGNVFFDVNRANITVNSVIVNPLEVEGIYVNNPNDVTVGGWSTVFRQQFDGSNFGYKLTPANAIQTVPWINVNEMVVLYGAPVDTASLDAGDFVLTGTPGTKFEPSEMPGIVRTITSFAPDVANPAAVRLTLSGFLEPSLLNLAVNASGISTNMVFGDDINQDFLALPGDFDTSYRVLLNDATPIVPLIGKNVGDMGYSARADMDGSGRVLFADATQVIGKIGDFLTLSRPSYFSSGGANLMRALQPPIPDRTDSNGPVGRLASVIPSNLGKSGSSLAGSMNIVDPQMNQLDHAIDELFGRGKKKAGRQLFDGEHPGIKLS